ncbi:MAG: hypothetical protein ACD_4C00003G0001, partial [uncultured bacterium (gcode 4)]
DDTKKVEALNKILLKIEKRLSRVSNSSTRVKLEALRDVTQIKLDDFVDWVKLRWDGSVDDNSSLNNADDFVNWVKLRWDWTIDDN